MDKEERNQTSEKPSPRPRDPWYANRTVRFIITAALVLLMLIPLSMVGSVVSERHSAYNGVLADISSHWGREQVLVGPMLVVPYTEVYEAVEKRKDSQGKEEEVRSRVSRDFTAVILPKKLAVDGVMSPEYRRRGIYQSLVYSLEMSMKARFAEVEAGVRGLSAADRLYQIHWNKAMLVVGMSDTKGIARVGSLEFANKRMSLAPGVGVDGLLSSGFHAPLDMGPISSAEVGLDLKIKGSDGFKMAPLGEWTQLKLRSTWAHPSFYGELLPSSRKIDAKGFEAAWSIPHLVRSYPQSFVLGNGHEAAAASFSAGARLFEPVTLYTEATRAVKYGFLFVALTFLTLILMELVTGARPTIVQYVIIGLALSLFFLLLIALSEHIGFNLAYAVAALTVVAMNTLYCLAVLGKKSSALVVMAVLAALYVVLFMVLRAEDFALLTGAVLLVIAIAATMFVTRNLNR